MPHKCVTNLFCAVSLLRRIAMRCVDAWSSTGFSLCTVNGPQLKPHRLKPVLPHRALPVLFLLALNSAGNFDRVHASNAGDSSSQGGTQSNNGVHREEGHERIDRMPVAQCSMRDVIRNR